MNKRLVTALLLSQAAAAALAQASISSTVTAAGETKSVAMQCGGVGQDEQERIKAEAPQHDLLLTFATPGGAYLANVDVQISRGGKVVLKGRCNGPLMLVDLAPRGNYEVTAISDGREQRKTVMIGAGKPARMSFIWPAD